MPTKLIDYHTKDVTMEKTKMDKKRIKTIIEIYQARFKQVVDVSDNDLEEMLEEFNKVRKEESMQRLIENIYG
tara:strand:- start:648 stop:866 length:219 start_codon:yes stop_codon:yes gene_type:complete